MIGQSKQTSRKRRILPCFMAFCAAISMLLPASAAVLPAGGLVEAKAAVLSSEPMQQTSSAAEAAVVTLQQMEGYVPEALMLTPGRDTSEINLTWYSDEAAGSGLVKFGEIRVRAESGPATAGKIWHKAVVTGLTPDTTYTYSVSNDGTMFSREYTYQTTGTGDFTFASVGDPQLTTRLQDPTSNLFSSDKSTRQGWADTVSAMQEKLGDTLSFIAGVGDQVDLSTPSNEDAVAENEREYGNFTAPEWLRSIPFAPAVGNHDRHYGFAFHYNLPNEQDFSVLQSEHYGNAANDQAASAESKGNYYYTYNNALFVVLNTSAYPANTEAAGVLVERFDSVLQKAVTENPSYDWLFVQHHKSTASVADHIADRDIQYYVEAGFEKLMDKYQVDFVLGGHDHVYARSYPMKDGKRGDNQGGSVINDPNGTIYMTFTTASGLKYYELFNAAGNLYVKDNSEYPYLVNGLQGSMEYAKGTLPLSNAKYLQAKKPAFTSIHVTKDSVTFETYNIDDLETAIDSFEVTKGAATGSGNISTAVPAGEIEIPVTGSTESLKTTEGLSRVVPPVPVERKDTVYTVQEGETIWGIAFNYYGSMQKAAVDKIYRANAEVLKAGGGVRAGMVLVLPSDGIQKPIAQSGTDQILGMYLVKAGDSLSKIAYQYYGRAGDWEKLYEANKSKIKMVAGTPMIYEGQWLAVVR